MWDAADALVVKTSAVWTSALACAGGKPIVSKAVFESTPKAMPSAPSTSCAPNPTAKNNHQVSKKSPLLSRQSGFTAAAQPIRLSVANQRDTKLDNIRNIPQINPVGASSGYTATLVRKVSTSLRRFSATSSTDFEAASTVWADCWAPAVASATSLNAATMSVVPSAALVTFCEISPVAARGDILNERRRSSAHLGRARQTG
jgi:hypothetical protein